MVGSKPLAAWLRRTTCVAYPRSGHHFLVDCLADYFGLRRHGAESLRDFTDADLPYCEHYQCPMNLDCPEVSAPCRHGLPLQKTHDFHHDYPTDAADRVVVQAREPALAIMSRYQLAMRRRGTPIDESLRPNWANFAELQTDYWLRFVETWAFAPVENRIIVAYESLTTEPGPLRAVLDHITADDVAITPDRVGPILDKNAFAGTKARQSDDFPIVTVEIVNGIRERTHAAWREVRTSAV